MGIVIRFPTLYRIAWTDGERAGLLGIEHDISPWLGALDGFTDAAVLCLTLSFMLG